MKKNDNLYIIERISKQNILVRLRLSFSYSPSQINLVEIQEVLVTPTPQFREHIFGQQITFTVHITERGRNEDPDSFPCQYRSFNGDHGGICCSLSPAHLKCLKF